MIIDAALISVLSSYGINYSFFSDEQKEALRIQGDYSKIVKALDFLVNELGIKSKNIEKCPSVLYFNPECIEENYKFLINNGFDKNKIENCLHVLSSIPNDLKDTYQYVVDNYGVETFNKNVTILSTNVSRIKDIEKHFSERMSKSAILSVANTTLRYSEIDDILDICEKNNVQVTSSFFQKGKEEIKAIIGICKKENIAITGSVFRKSSEDLRSIINVCRSKGVPIVSSVFLQDSVEVSKIIDVCRENNIEITGSVFRRDAEEIKDIISLCNEKKINISGTLFLRTADEIKRILNVCEEHNILVQANIFKKSALEIEEIVSVCEKHGVDVSATMFSKSASSLDKSMDYIEKNYGKSYLTPLIVVTSESHLRNVFPYLEEKGVLPAVINSPAILTLKFDEIKEREIFISKIGEEDVVKGKFNSIYGLSRKRYKGRLNSTTYVGGNEK